MCTIAPGGLLSRDFHAVSVSEFHVTGLDHGNTTGSLEPCACWLGEGCNSSGNGRIDVTC